MAAIGAIGIGIERLAAIEDCYPWESLQQGACPECITTTPTCDLCGSRRCIQCTTDFCLCEGTQGVDYVRPKSLCNCEPDMCAPRWGWVGWFADARFR